MRTSRVTPAWAAAEVKRHLRALHPGHGGQMPGPWTVIEEYRQIDLLAFSAWGSQGRFARVGYEVKVSRADLRGELLRPAKRARNVAWCNEFYFALPFGLLTDAEVLFDEPAWMREAAAFEREPCTCYRGHRRGWEPCPECQGRGYLARSRVELEAPTCWVPADVGLVLVDRRHAWVVRPAPRRNDVPPLGPRDVGQLVRWVSMRPDPRHHGGAYTEPGALAAAALDFGAV